MITFCQLSTFVFFLEMFQDVEYRRVDDISLADEPDPRARWFWVRVRLLQQLLLCQILTLFVFFINTVAILSELGQFIDEALQQNSIPFHFQSPLYFSSKLLFPASHSFPLWPGYPSQWTLRQGSSRSIPPYVRHIFRGNTSIQLESLNVCSIFRVSYSPQLCLSSSADTEQ